MLQAYHGIGAYGLDVLQSLGQIPGELRPVLGVHLGQCRAQALHQLFFGGGALLLQGSDL